MNTINGPPGLPVIRAGHGRLETVHVAGPVTMVREYGGLWGRSPQAEWTVCVLTITHQKKKELPLTKINDLWLI